MILTSAENAIHNQHGDIDKCFTVMLRVIDETGGDADLVFQAKAGMLKRDINVPAKLMTEPEGRKLFLINIIDQCVKFKALELDRKHLLSAFRTFCFHCAQLRIAEKRDLINETLPTEFNI